MEAKEKAKELVNKYLQIYDGRVVEGKKCALIAVDEIFEHIDYIFTELEKDKFPNKFDDEIEYWNEVKQEILKL